MRPSIARRRQQTILLDCSQQTYHRRNIIRTVAAEVAVVVLGNVDMVVYSVVVVAVLAAIVVAEVVVFLVARVVMNLVVLVNEARPNHLQVR